MEKNVNIDLVSLGNRVVLAFLFLISLYILDAPVGSNAAYSALLDRGKEVIDGITPTFDWQIVFLVGVFLGSLVAAAVSRDFKLQLFPEDHLSKGTGVFFLTLGPVFSFLGGVFVMSGLILAGNSFLKLWSDCLGLYIIIGLFLIIVFVEAVILGTMLSVKIEEK